MPEAERTYYLFFVNDRQRDEWLEAVATNIELHRRAHGKIEEMIDRVVPLAETGAVPWDKIGIVKMALRSRFQSKLNVLTGGPFITALKLCALGDETGLRTSLKVWVGREEGAGAGAGRERRGRKRATNKQGVGATTLTCFQQPPQPTSRGRR